MALKSKNNGSGSNWNILYGIGAPFSSAFLKRTHEDEDPDFIKDGFFKHVIGFPAVNAKFAVKRVKVKYECLDVLREFRDEPLFICANHQGEDDIPVIGKALVNSNGRFAHYIMGKFLENRATGLLYRHGGGVSFTRGRDYQKRKPRSEGNGFSKELKEARRVFREEMREEDEGRRSYLEGIYAKSIKRGEVMVVFPEGRIIKNEDFNPRKDALERLLSGQELAGVKAPIVPMKIEYGAFDRKPWGTGINVTIGEPRTFENGDVSGLRDYLIENIR